MTLPIAALVLFAALLHASWNALLKSGQDRFWSMTVMGIGTSLACAVLLFFLPLPAGAQLAFPCRLGAAPCRLQRFPDPRLCSGEFGTAYPVARGSSPLLVTLGAALAANELPGIRAWPAFCWSAAASSRWPFAAAACPKAASSTRWAPAVSSPPTASPTASAGGCPAMPWPIPVDVPVMGRHRRADLSGAAARRSCGAAPAGQDWPRWAGSFRCWLTASSFSP